MQITQIIPASTRLVDAAKQASVSGLHLLTDGKRTILSPQRLPGWFRIGVSIKEAA